MTDTIATILKPIHAQFRAARAVFCCRGVSDLERKAILKAGSVAAALMMTLPVGGSSKPILSATSEPPAATHVSQSPLATSPLAQLVTVSYDPALSHSSQSPVASAFSASPVFTSSAKSSLTPSLLPFFSASLVVALADDAGSHFSPKSYAQGGSLVIPNSGELKLHGHTGRTIKSDTAVKKRPSPLPLRVTDLQREMIYAKAKMVGVSVNHFVLASVLGSHYRPPLHRDLLKVLLMLYRELAAQGNNFNQVARQLNSRILSEASGEAMMDVLGQSLIQTQQAVRNALSLSMPPEPQS